jgi:hypothetical protein
MEEELVSAPPPSLPKTRKFHARSRFLLRLGKTLVAPTRMFISSPSEMTEMMFQDIMDQLKIYIADEIMLNPLSGKLMVASKYTPTAPRHHVKASLHFMYYWVPRDVEFNLLIAQKNTQAPLQKMSDADAMEVDTPVIQSSKSSSVALSETTEVITPKKATAAPMVDAPAAPTVSGGVTFTEMTICDQMIVVVVLKPAKKSLDGDEIDFSQGAAVENQISRYFGAHHHLTSETSFRSICLPTIPLTPQFRTGAS